MRIVGINGCFLKSYISVELLCWDHGATMLDIHTLMGYFWLFRISGQWHRPPVVIVVCIE